jgi:hypothetical protein
VPGAVPGAVVGATGDTERQLLALAKTEGRELSGRYGWECLTQEATFVTVATENQGTLDSIITGDVILCQGPLGDYEAIITGRTWHRTGPIGTELEIVSMHGEDKLPTHTPGGTVYACYRKLTEYQGAEPGAHVGSHHGTYALPMVIQLACSFGMALSPKDDGLLRRAGDGDDVLGGGGVSGDVQGVAGHTRFGFADA